MFDANTDFWCFSTNPPSPAEMAWSTARHEPRTKMLP
jgi:hypothetical protein